MARENEDAETRSGPGSTETYEARDSRIPSPRLESGELFADRFEIRALLGRGGFSTVYRAFDRVLRREVALKLLRPERTDARSLARFRREAAVARDVASRNLARIHEIGEIQGQPYLVLELLAAESLRDRLRDGALPVAAVAELARELLRALAALHEARILHRDVKPSNVLFSAAGEAKLADLGLALPLESDETRATLAEELVGTLDYVSPEQALGRELEPRSDLYSLGLVLFEALTARRAFEGETSMERVVARVSRSPPQVRQIRREVPRWLSEVVGRLTERDPQRRYASATDALGDVERERAPRSRASGDRRVATGLGVLVLAVAAGVMLWNEVRARKFSHLRPMEGDGPVGIEAVDGRGRVLWQKAGIWPSIASRSALASLAPGAPERIVTILHAEGDHRPSTYTRLSVLDPATGEEERSTTLPTPTEAFGRVSPRFVPLSVSAADLDGDGGDEVIVSLVSVPSWPSYTVLWEPRLDRSRIVYAAAGHETFEDAVDVDGDGRKELIFLGINSVLGSYRTLAIQRVVPGVGELPSRGGASLGPTAWTPGTGWFRHSGESLLAYRLLPRGELRNARLEEARVVFEGPRLLRIRFEDRPPVRLEWGNEESSRAALEAMDEALRLSGAGAWSDALSEIERGRTALTGVDDPILAGCVDRIRAKILVRSGATEAGEAELERLAGTLEYASEVAWDAGSAFHFRGDLERAVRWYRRGIEAIGSGHGGKNPWFFLEGAVMARLEQGRFDDAIAEVAHYSSTFPDHVWTADLLLGYIAVRRGHVPGIEPHLVSTDTEMQRYLAREIQYANGRDPDELLGDLEPEDLEPAETRGAFLSLRGEVLFGLGRREEGEASLRRAVDLLRVASAREPAFRSVLRHAEERWARFGRGGSAQTRGSR